MGSLDLSLSDEDLLELQRSGSDYPEEDRTVTVIPPNSEREHDLEDFLEKKNSNLINKAINHKKEEVFVQQQVEAINMQIQAEKNAIQEKEEANRKAAEEREKREAEAKKKAQVEKQKHIQDIDNLEIDEDIGVNDSFCFFTKE